MLGKHRGQMSSSIKTLQLEHSEFTTKGLSQVSQMSFWKASKERGNQPASQPSVLFSSLADGWIQLDLFLDMIFWRGSKRWRWLECTAISAWWSSEVCQKAEIYNNGQQIIVISPSSYFAAPSISKFTSHQIKMVRFSSDAWDKNK